MATRSPHPGRRRAGACARKPIRLRVPFADGATELTPMPFKDGESAATVKTIGHWKRRLGTCTDRDRRRPVLPVGSLAVTEACARRTRRSLAVLSDPRDE